MLWESSMWVGGMGVESVCNVIREPGESGTRGVSPPGSSCAQGSRWASSDTG